MYERRRIREVRETYACGVDEGAKTVPPPQIPLAFVGTALLMLGATLLWILLGNLAPLALLHALIVGVFLMVAMGLIYQFVPVVAMAPLRWPQAAFVHLALAVVGTACIVGGFQMVNFTLVRLGGSFLAAGVLLQAIVLGVTVRGRKPPAPALGAVLSLLWLLLTIGIGIWLADRFARGYTVGDVARYHALVGLAGFFGTLVTAVTFRLMRMFERVNVEGRISVLAIAVTIATLVALARGALGGYALLALAIAVGAGVFAVARARNPAYQRETFAYGVTSAAGALAASAAYAAGAFEMAAASAVWYYIGTAVVGYLQRIVPFIWWIRRSHREGVKNIPTLAEMNDSRLGYVILGLWVSAGMLWLAQPEKRFAAAVALAAWAMLIVQLQRPFTAHKAHRD